MKTMTCRQLGGACDLQLKAETFDEMAAKSRAHGQEMFKKGDQAHIEAANKMMHLISDPKAMQQWMDTKKKEFEELEED